jgi:formylglycine-generating enzyme required for sulfatase activity
MGGWLQRSCNEKKVNIKMANEHRIVETPTARSDVKKHSIITFIFLFAGLAVVVIALKLFAISVTNKPSNAVESQAVISPIDDAPMILIPSGEFQMGDYLGNGEEDEHPLHTVYLNAFYIDKYEVTNAQYRRFVQATGHRPPMGYRDVNGELQVIFKPWLDKNFNDDNMPVVCVSWDDAVAYSEWVGKRIPTEAEWEKAARGGYLVPRLGMGNFADKALKDKFPEMNCLEIYNDKYVYTAPVGKFDSNGYGLYDVMGNVWEWCFDWYNRNYYSKSPKKNPQGPDSGTIRVVRGGAWYSPLQDLRVSSRGSGNPSYWYLGVGFRCVKGISSKNGGI